MTTEKDLEDIILGFHRKLIEELQKEAERLHITPSQLQVLQCISEREHPTMKDIANELRITPPSVTTIVESLHDQGFVRREEDQNDRRVVRISITPKTYKMYSSLKDAKFIVLKNLFAKLSEEDRSALSKIITKIINT